VQEAENDLPKQMDYFLKKENFEKVKKAFEAKPEKNRTQKDVDLFNEGVKEINKVNNTFNDINKKANDGRNDAIANGTRPKNLLLTAICPIINDTIIFIT
jgi:hypothetical protein